MLVAFDVHYDDAVQRAATAAVWFEAWDSDAATGSRIRLIDGIAPYVPGRFFERELPCILPLARSLILELRPTILVIDAHVDLGPDHPGLGRHLQDALDPQGRPEIVGVAKRSFHQGVGVPIVRGDSQQPLWITSTDDADAAARGVAAMDGPFRIPTLLRLVDRLARQGLVS